MASDPIDEEARRLVREWNESTSTDAVAFVAKAVRRGHEMEREAVRAQAERWARACEKHDDHASGAALNNFGESIGLGDHHPNGDPLKDGE